MKPENFIQSFFANSKIRSLIFFSIFVLAAFSNNYGYPQAQISEANGADSLIKSLISEVNPDNLKSTIQSLQDFGTRFLLAPNRFQAADWIKNKFISYGYNNVQEDSFQMNSFLGYFFPSKYDTTTWQKNIIAELKGSRYPEDIIVIGGHYDDFTNTSSDFYSNVPGADDNASGTAGVIEIARIFMQKGIRPERTVIFAAFSGEELMFYGGSGARDLVYKLAQSGKNIKAMINLDMIAYSQSAPMDSTYLFTLTNSNQLKLNNQLSLFKRFLKTNPAAEIIKNTTSDALPFADCGIPTFYYMEYNFNPYYHSSKDVLSNCNMNYCAEMVKSAAVLLSNLTMMPDSVRYIQLINHGDNKTMTVKWPKQNNITGYKFYLGPDSLTYDKIIYTQDTSIVISDLAGRKNYFIAVSTVNSLGLESYAVGRFGMPQFGPLAPFDFRDNPLMGKIELVWSGNLDPILQGYNIYRSESIQGNFVKIHTSEKNDTSFVDETVKKGFYYFYTIKSFDNLGNESIDNRIIKSRAISLDQGVLVIDNTRDGNGGAANPTDQQVDDFYDYIVKEFNYKSYDLNKEKTIKLADLGAFSTVILHKDDTYADGAYPFIVELKKYLDNGGNFIFSGYFPSRLFAQNKTTLNNFGPGSFIYDYLKIKHSEIKEFSMFGGASPNFQGFNLMLRETEKRFPSGVESIQPIDSSLILFKYYSQSKPTTPYGSMSEMPVGVGYFGNNYKAVILSFPLYYMMKDPAKNLIRYLLEKKFGELTDVDISQKHVPSDFSLGQNYPNPFNPATTISYSLPKQSRVELKIFDVLGREISSLVNKEQAPGEYKIVFNGSLLPSGIYIYSIQAGQFRDSKKFLLLK